MCFRRAKERHSELLAMLDEPDDAIRLESRSSRESKHKGNLLNTLALGTQRSPAAPGALLGPDAERAYGHSRSSFLLGNA